MIDAANNTAKARSLLLYDPDNGVTVNPKGRMYVSNAIEESNFKWLINYNLSAGINVMLNWTDYFENKFHHEKGLLNPVRPAASDVIDDKEGNRTTAGIPNVRGIVRFSVTHKKDKHINNLKHKPDLEVTIQNIHHQSFNAVYPTANDGETVKFWVTASDILGNNLTRTYMVHMDSSPPEIGKASHEINVATEGVPYGTR